MPFNWPAFQAQRAIKKEPQSGELLKPFNWPAFSAPRSINTHVNTEPESQDASKLTLINFYRVTGVTLPAEDSGHRFVWAMRGYKPYESTFISRRSVANVSVITMHLQNTGTIRRFPPRHSRCSSSENFQCKHSSEMDHLHGC